MFDRMPTLTKTQMTKIHDAAMNILSGVGVAFNEEESLDIFKKTVLKLNKRLANYEKPDIDPAIEWELSEYVTRRKSG